MNEKINVKNAPAAIGPYSHAAILDRLIFTSGQIPINPQTGEIEGDTIGVQTHRVCQNIDAVLSEFGSSLDMVMKTVCYLSDMNDFAEFNEIYALYFKTKPARSCVAVKGLPKGALVEIEVVAEKL